MDSLKRLWRTVRAFVRPGLEETMLVASGVVMVNPRHFDRVNAAVGHAMPVVAWPYVPAWRRLGRREAARAAWRA